MLLVITKDPVRWHSTTD